ncbi:MAG TPA: thymidylate kinase [Verrucomicrobiae bacterium]|nr:thymidylate kinase [Verrucomicrobiae bacterium]
MAERGKFVVLEGIDGSGKRTQLEMLARACSERGLSCSRYAFPNYAGFFGKLVARYLNGDFGSLADVAPSFSALLYAGDRFESKPKIEKELSSGRLVLADRYIGSNLAHQGARVAPEKRDEFLAWLKELEYGVYALPSEDLVIYLSLPARQAQGLIEQKEQRDYTKLRRDIHEASLSHLEAATEVYDHLAEQSNWMKIECWDGLRQTLRTPDSIHQDVLAAVDLRVLAGFSGIGKPSGI